jgi:hypothetical protein
MPQADVRESHTTMIRAPADIVFDVARTLDIMSIPAVKFIFWLRGALLGAAPMRKDLPRGFVASTAAMGWGVLAERRRREYVAGAVTEPWEADVTFKAIPPERFAAFADPGLVKIVWTLEAEWLEPALTRFRSETRAVATDEAARAKFRRYWRKFGVGIVLIRWLVGPAIRREAKRRYRELAWIQRL